MSGSSQDYDAVQCLIIFEWLEAHDEGFVALSNNRAWLLLNRTEYDVFPLHNS
jgi:hypothetical protein